MVATYISTLSALYGITGSLGAEAYKSYCVLRLYADLAIRYLLRKFNMYLPVPAHGCSSAFEGSLSNVNMLSAYEPGRCSLSVASGTCAPNMDTPATSSRCTSGM